MIYMGAAAGDFLLNLILFLFVVCVSAGHYHIKHEKLHRMRMQKKYSMHNNKHVLPLSTTARCIQVTKSLSMQDMRNHIPNNYARTRLKSRKSFLSCTFSFLFLYAKCILH